MNREMKDSGFEWIGKIPVSWNVVRMGSHVKEIVDKNNPITTTNILSLTNKLGVIPYEDKGNQGNKSKEDLSDYKLAYKDTIVANSMNIIIGSVGYSEYDGCISPVYYVFKEKDNETNLHFINYLMQTKQYQNELRKFANGIMEIRLRLSSDNILKDLKIAFPLKDEQDNIVKYLDIKCNKIDNAISQVEQSIEKLEVLKQSIITKIVFNGLSKNVEYKDSETNWAGKIPVNWTIMPLKTRFNFGKGLSITKADLVDEGLPVISYGQVHAKFNSGVRVDDGLIRYVPESFAQYKESFAHNNDFIFADTSEDLEGCGNCVYVDNEGVYAGYHTVLLSSKYDDNNKYLAYLFKTDAWRYQIRTQLTDVKLFSITQGCLKQTEILLPPQPEQDDIVKYLDEKCSKIDESIKRQKDIIEKLDEYKKSLIYNVVTGKTEVPNGN